MNLQNMKCVMVIDETLPAGLAANTTAILGITVGQRCPEIVGADPIDHSGAAHAGIVEFPVPILKGDPERIRALRAKLDQPEFQTLTSADFSELAQGCRTYGEFIEKMAACPEGNLRYFGLAICGDRKKVDRLTGSLPLFR